MLCKWRSQWQSAPQPVPIQDLASVALHIRIGIIFRWHDCVLMNVHFTIEAHQYLLLLRFSWVIKIDFFLSCDNLNPLLETHFHTVCIAVVTQTLSAQPPCHNFSSWRILQALLCQQHLECFIQSARKNKKPWKSMHLSNKWFLFTVDSTKACLSL